MVGIAGRMTGTDSPIAPASPGGTIKDSMFSTATIIVNATIVQTTGTLSVSLKCKYLLVLGTTNKFYYHLPRHKNRYLSATINAVVYTLPVKVKL